MFRAGQRIIVIGPPGCGKTRWEMALLEGVGSVVVFDAPQDPAEWTSWGPAFGYLVTDDVDQIRRAPRVVFQVDDLALQDRRGWTQEGSVGWQWTLACMAVWERGHTTVVFAEGLQLLPSAGANPWARKLITQGRKRGITSLTDIQVANWTDTLMVRMADHAISFRVTAPDVRILRDRGADPRPLLTLEDHAWGHHAQGAREWTVYEALPKHRIWGGAPDAASRLRRSARAHDRGPRRTRRVRGAGGPQDGSDVAVVASEAPIGR